MATDMSERLRAPVSVAELERRWAEARKAMAKEGVDAVVAQGQNVHMGYTRWFHDIPVYTGYPWTVVFYAEGGMITVTHGVKSPRARIPEWVPSNVGVRQRFSEPYFVSCNYTGTEDAEVAVRDLRGRGVKRVGVVGPAVMSASFHNHLTANLERVEIVDFTEQIDRIMVVKSPEEIGLIKRTAQLQDEAFAEILDFIRPGVKEYEILARLTGICIAKGTEHAWIMIGSGPKTEPVVTKSPFYQNRTVGPNDAVAILLEPNGPGGYYAELRRVVCLGSVPDDLAGANALSAEAQDYVARLLVPGAMPAAVHKKHNDWMASHGLPPDDNRAMAHGQGYNLVERPVIRSEDPMPVAANMNFAIHVPGVVNRATVSIVDNFIITDNGPEAIHRTARKVFEI